jgi:threonine synthase
VPDEQILQVMRAIGGEGLCIEPASAVAAAGLVHARMAGWIGDDETVVAMLTSSGIKWPRELGLVTEGAAVLESDLAALRDALRTRGLDTTGQPVG